MFSTQDASVVLGLAPAGRAGSGLDRREQRAPAGAAQPASRP